MRKSLKILIVDDEVLIRRSLQLAGESRGHIVKSAEDGVSALSLWPSFGPDLAFIDILMPQMDGFGLLKKIPVESKAKTIMISAHDKMSERDIKKRGADLFIKKPFNDIFQIIERAEELAKSDRKSFNLELLDENYQRKI